MKLIVIFSVLVQLLGSYALIIPDELPSLLSVIYSNIPTLKKGTDSRLGWGFRLGDRADFQVMLELGPQKDTQRLANQQDESSNSKRNTLETLAETLYAQRQHEKKEKQRKIQNEKKKVISTSDSESVALENSPGAEWLKTWSKSVNQKKDHPKVPLNAKPGIAIGEIDAKSVIPNDSDEQPQEKSLQLEKIQSTTLKSTAATEEPLDEVAID